MKANNREYGYYIEPFYGKIMAEIYRVNGELHIHVTSKSFGRWYREPNNDDYREAREWAEKQMSLIYYANKLND